MAPPILVHHPTLPHTQREADAAAERASHWCSLAEVLQRSALLPDAPLSPGGLSSLGSLGSTPRGSVAKSATALSRSVSRSGHSSNDAGSCALQQLAQWRSPTSVQHQLQQLEHRPTTADRYAGTSISASSSQEGPGLIAAFQAVAGLTAAGQDTTQGSPPPCRCSLQPATEQASPAHIASIRAESATAASSDLAPGSHLQLLKRLATPGLSFASSAGDSPLTPALGAPPPGKGELWIAGEVGCSDGCAMLPTGF